MKQTRRSPVIVLLFFSFIYLYSVQKTTAQCQLLIKIDGIPAVVNATDASGITLPYWLKANQTLAAGASVGSISVKEYTINNTILEFSQILTVVSTTGVTVPANKVWEVVSVKGNNSNSSRKISSIKYSVPGSYSFILPSCAEQVCIEVWGAGGAGGGATSYLSGTFINGGGGGGGGGYGSQCFFTSPGSTLSITVGAGGTGVSANNGNAGGTTSVSGTNVSVSASGGGGGSTLGNGGAGGAGGTSSATFNYTGQNGFNGSSSSGAAGGTCGYIGIDIGAGGANQFSSTTGNIGSAPGGGGSGGFNNNSSGTRIGGAGGAGQVSISW